MWEHPKELRELKDFYGKLKNNPDSISDAEVISKIESSFWGTNCWSYVEQSLAIIAPACFYKPHLTTVLIKYPIEAMIAGGLDNYKDVIAYALVIAEKENPYVPLTEEGMCWLKNTWPILDEDIKNIFLEIWNKLN